MIESVLVFNLTFIGPVSSSARQLCTLYQVQRRAYIDMLVLPELLFSGGFWSLKSVGIHKNNLDLEGLIQVTGSGSLWQLTVCHVTLSAVSWPTYADQYEIRFNNV
jgi:hypothetical protein